MPYSPKIHKVTNGWIVEAGCMTLVFENDERLIDEFARWIRRPEMVEKEYIEKFGAIPVDPRQPGAEARIRRDDIHYDHGDCVTGLSPAQLREEVETDAASTPPSRGTRIR